MSKHPELLVQYTADEAEKELLAIEGHGSRIADSDSPSGPIVDWCLFCVRKHLGYLTELADECVKGQCHSEPVWREMRKWTSDNRGKITEIIREQRLMSDSEIQELVRQARIFRKEMEKLALDGPRVSQPGHLV